MQRISSIKRETRETKISLKINLDGSGKLSGEIPIGFFAHMMSHLAKYSLIDMEINLQGDLHIDAHHSVEDTAIVLGSAIREAVGDKKGITRYGDCTLPMDETLTTAALDLSGRGYFKYTGPDLRTMQPFGNYHSELTLEFMEKLAMNVAMNLHILVHYGQNYHHIHESIFKAVGWALRKSLEKDPRRKDEIPSTKGII